MKKMEPDKVIDYWKKTAERDYETMIGLFKIKRYSEALFFGHILLEKILKSCVVKKTQQHSPFSHDLVRLMNMAEIKLESSEINLLHEVNKFNIRARYPDYKLAFYKKCTKSFTYHYLQSIVSLYKKLCQTLK